MNPLNETCIIFNETFKALIREILNLNPGGCIGGISSASVMSYNVDTILESQQIIRDWFKTRVYIRNGVMAQPDYYAILNAVICDIERCYSWDDVFKQVASSHSSNMSFVMADDDDDSENILLRCICGHYCSRKHLALTTNPYTNLNCITACDCITKVGIITKHAFKKASKQSSDLRMRKRQHLFTKFANLVFKYVDVRDRFRLCCDCSQYTVLQTDPRWKCRCFPCWRQINKKTESK